MGPPSLWPRCEETHSAQDTPASYCSYSCYLPCCHCTLLTMLPEPTSQNRNISPIYPTITHRFVKVVAYQARVAVWRTGRTIIEPCHQRNICAVYVVVTVEVWRPSINPFLSFGRAAACGRSAHVYLRTVAKPIPICIGCVLTKC